MADPVDQGAEPEEKGVPRLVRFLAQHMAFGIALGAAFASLLIMTDAGGLRTVLDRVSEPFIALLLLYVMCALTFGSVAMGVGIMSLPWGEPCDMRDPERKDADGE